MRLAPGVFAALAVAFFSASCLVVDPRNQARSQPIAAQGERPGPQIHLFRGFANVFSLGMDILAAEIEETGVDAAVHNHLLWLPIAEDIVKRRQEDGRNRPIVLIGHSLGAGAVVGIARHLAKQEIRVDLLVMVGLVGGATLPANVVRALNIEPHRVDGIVVGAPGFRGEIVDIGLRDDLDASWTNHFTMESNAELHSLVVGEISRAVRRARTGS